MEPLHIPGLLLGIRAEEPLSDHEFHFSSGDHLLLYSDGLAEAEDLDKVSFGDGCLAQLMMESQLMTTERGASKLEVL